MDKVEVDILPYTLHGSSHVKKKGRWFSTNNLFLLGNFEPIWVFDRN